MSETKHTPTPGPWTVTIESPNYMTVRITPAPTCIEQAWANRKLVEATPTLVEALRDLELRACQDRLACGIGKKKNRAEFLLGSLQRIQDAARAALRAAGEEANP